MYNNNGRHNKKSLFIIAILMCIIAWGGLALLESKQVTEAKTLMLANNEQALVDKEKELIKSEEEISNLTIEVEAKSDIEILLEMSQLAGQDAEAWLIKVGALKEAVSQAEQFYEKNLLIKMCADTQMDRKSDNLEYDIHYCDDEENLEEFRTKK